jgi:hypothetical protein
MTDTVPEEVWINARIITYDVSKEWETYEEDYFSIKVVSSYETKTELACANWPLSIKANTEMSGTRSYSVGQMKRIPISIELEGEADVAKDCKGLYYWALSYERASGSYETIWTSKQDENKDMNMDMNDYAAGELEDDIIWIEDGELVIDMTQE